MSISRMPTTPTKDQLFMLIVEALQKNCEATMSLTSRSSMIARGRPPDVSLLLMQMTSNQVAIMQALQKILEVLVDDFGHLFREGLEN